MPATKLNILQIDSRRDDIRAAMAELRRRLSPEGNVVSQAGRQRTIEVFGEPLSPRQVVERICRDVKEQGLAAVLDYSRPDRQGRADGRRRSACRARSWLGPTPAADAGLLAAVRRVRRRIEEFQEAILHRDVRAGRARRLPGAALPAAGPGGDLRAGRGGGLSVHGADDGRARPGGRREATGRGGPAHAVRRLQSRSAGHLPRVGHRRGLSAGRGPGRGRPGLRRRGDSAGGQDRRAGQPVRRLGQAARLRRGGHRFDRRPQRGGGDRGPLDAAGLHGRRPDRPGRARPGGQHADRLGRGGAGRRGGASWAGSWPAWSAASWPGRAWKSSAR